MGIRYGIRGNRFFRVCAAVSAFALSCAVVDAVPAGDARAETAVDESAAESRPRRDDYVRARVKAREWLDGLEVDVFALTSRGTAGIKKLGEALAAYRFLWESATDEPQRDAILRRVRELAVQTEADAYHEILKGNDGRFDQSNMSYLRVLVLLEGFGSDTSAYRARLAEFQARMLERLPYRQPWERQAFVRYLTGFGFEVPKEADARSEYLTARRLPLKQVSVGEAYALTHELYVAFEYGLSEEQSDLSADDLAYLRRIVPAVLRDSLDVKMTDLAAELLSSMTYLGLAGHPQYERAIDYLLDTQNDEGTWGYYEHLRPSIGDLVEQRHYLHTTLVALAALVEAFDMDWPALAAPSTETDTAIEATPK